MKKSGLLGYSILAVATLAIAACATHTTRRLSCSGHGGNAGGIHQAECHVTVQKNAVVGLLDFSTFDAAKAWLDLSDSNILAKPLVAVSINLVLRRSGSIVGSASFPATQSGSMVRFNFPASVTNWLRSFGGLADELTGDVAGLGFTEKDGTNVVTVKLVYDGSVDTGVSQSWYRSDDGGSCGGCALN